MQWCGARHRMGACFGRTGGCPVHGTRKGTPRPGKKQKKMASSGSTVGKIDNTLFVATICTINIRYMVWYILYYCCAAICGGALEHTYALKSASVMKKLLQVPAHRRRRHFLLEVAPTRAHRSAPGGGGGAPPASKGLRSQPFKRTDYASALDGTS